MDQHVVLRARMRLLSADEWVLSGPDALWVYRALNEVSPQVYGAKLAHVLVVASRFRRVRELPEARAALLREAVEAASALAAGARFRDAVLADALAALAALEAPVFGGDPLGVGEAPQG
ncbi:hypothetical protein OG455_38665 [Kitasatospora sp. NBC_01287]|uniref:hypothetical protein n=1 Tax=Kitasatospora sp. NBC_01287 TaxID=2903573 RepID=UPI0022583280|nr:hypothetical protein [Kitasatospora sp. NBC_01287]MCX4751360.1 hypothetical protein [Kitasatospora sp. NBC_01287]